VSRVPGRVVNQKPTGNFLGVAPPLIRRTHSSKDPRLRKLFAGERGRLKRTGELQAAKMRALDSPVWVRSVLASTLGELLTEAIDPLQPLLEVRHACSIAESDVIVRSERNSGHGGDLLGLE
jgi:hypothetical protein